MELTSGALSAVRLRDTARAGIKVQRRLTNNCMNVSSIRVGFQITYNVVCTLLNAEINASFSRGNPTEIRR